MSADLILARRFASFSRFFAIRSSAPSRKPPVSPARIIATISRGNVLSCLAIAADSDRPLSMSRRTSWIAFCSDGLVVCSSRIASERSSDSPEDVIVANCREKIARSLSEVLLPKPGILRSFCRPLPDSVIDSGMTPCWRSAAAAADSVEASSLPLLFLPFESRTSYS